MQAELAHAEAGAQIAQFIDTLSRIAIDEVAEFAGRYLKPDANRAVLLVPDAIRDVTHAQSRLTQEPEEPSGAEAATEPILKPRRRPPRPAQGRSCRQSSRRQARGRPWCGGCRTACPSSPCAGPGCRSCRCSWDFMPIRSRATRTARASPSITRWAGTCSKDRSSAGSAGPKLDGDDAQESLTMLAGNLDKGLDLLSEEGETLRVFWPNPHSIAGSIARRCVK